MCTMHRSQNPWNMGNLHQDSGSESAPLLSSGSHASTEAVIFQDSETSDMDSNPTDNCSRYGSIEAGSFRSTTTIVPRRLPPMTHDNVLVRSPPRNVSSPLTVPHDRCYEIHDVDSVLGNDKYASGRSQPPKKDYNGFLNESYSPRQEDARSTCKDVRPKQSSLVTIFSIWNTILGSSLLTMPWGIAMAGFFPGIILILLMSGLCLYTAYCLLTVHKYHGGHDGIEVTDLAKIYLSRWAQYIAKVSSIAVLLGATIAYWILMSNFLYNTVNFIYDNTAGGSGFMVINNSSVPEEVLCPRKVFYNNTNVIMHERSYDTLGPVWDLYRTVPVFLGLLIFPLLNFSSPTFFTKFNSIGTVSILYLIVFISVKSASWGVNMDERAWKESWMLQPTFAALSGMLSLSFFIHNIIITVMQSNRDQSKNGRDLSIAYFLVTITYVTIGVVFYICFPLSKSCIEDNLLNNFQKWDGLTVGARTVLLFQLLTVYPLLAYMLRVQLLSTVCKSFGRGWVILVNIVLVSVCILFATFVPYIGTIIRYTGALSGLIYVFTLPSLLYVVVLKKQGRLTTWSLLLNVSILIVGCTNLLAQFFISDR